MWAGSTTIFLWREAAVTVRSKVRENIITIYLGNSAGTKADGTVFR